MYQYKFEQYGDFPTVRRKKNGGYIISPSFAIVISEGFDKNHIFIPASAYYSFTSLFQKTVKLVSENLYTLFPDLNRIEFEIDSKALDRFQTEKALSTAGMTGIPCTWVNNLSETFPAIRITSNNGTVTIPLEDAVAIAEMFKGFDPLVSSVCMLRFCGTFDD